jgi:hypothetical protein
MIMRLRSSAGGLHVAIVMALVLLALLVILVFYYRPTFEWTWDSPWR